MKTNITSKSFALNAIAMLGATVFVFTASTVQAAPNFSRINSITTSPDGNNKKVDTNSIVEQFQAFVQKTLNTPKLRFGVVGTKTKPTKSQSDKDKAPCDQDESSVADEEYKEDTSAASGPEPIYFGF